MTMGKFLAGLIVISALLVGAGVYYMQVYALYTTVSAKDVGDVPPRKFHVVDCTTPLVSESRT